MKIINIKNYKSIISEGFRFNINTTILPTPIINKLIKSDLPIKNTRKAILNISSFLAYINHKIELENTTTISISRDIFYRFFGLHTYVQYKELLTELEIITKVPYEDGQWYNYNKENGKLKTQQYRVHNKYLNYEDYSIIIFPLSRRQKTKLKQTKKTDIQTKNVNPIMVNTIINAELDYAKVVQSELEHHISHQTTPFSLYVRLIRAFSLNHTRYIKNGNKVDRIYHSFSNLSKVTRKCFITKFNSIDLKNAQPILLALLLNKEGKSFEQEYTKICENGEFYELFMNNEHTDRDKIKVEVYKSLFFAFNKRSRVNKEFKLLFPQLWNILFEISKSEISLASRLQNIEADIFNNLLVDKSTQMFTLFDAIYFNNEKDVDYVCKQLNSYASRYNIKFTLDIEKGA
jgi:hypothetical protein